MVPRSLEAALQGNYTVRIGDYLSQGWQIFGRNGGGFVGYTAVTWLINLLAAVIPFGLGQVVTAAIAGPLWGGYFIPAFKSCRSQAGNFEDFFKAFESFLPLFLVNFVIWILGILIGLPLSLPVALWLQGAQPLAAQFLNQVLAADGEQLPDPDPATIAALSQVLSGIGILFLLFSLISLGLRLIYFFVFPLVLDRKLDFWPAMEASRKLALKQWPSLLGLLIVLDLLNLLGFVLCCLGLLVSVPLTVCVTTACYEDVLGIETQQF